MKKCPDSTPGYASYAILELLVAQVPYIGFELQPRLNSMKDRGDKQRARCLKSLKSYLGRRPSGLQSYRKT